MIDYKPIYLRTRETPRQIIFEDFKIDLPIKGGWGYTESDAVIIDRNDETVRDRPFFNGVGIEYILVEKRIYEELIVFRRKGDQFCDIKWKLQRQCLRGGKQEGQRYDLLIFEINAIHEPDWERFKAEYMAHDMFKGDRDGFVQHISERESHRISFVEEFWFDITSFIGKSLGNLR